MSRKTEINNKYTNFYAARTHKNVYPTEFVVRTLLASYPELDFKKPQKNDKILDIAFGDGRNTVLLCDMELDVSGIEITQGIVDQTQERLKAMGYSANLRVGRNNNIPFGDQQFDYILACHCCYYCDEEDTLIDNLKEYWRVLKPNGVLIASIANKESYIFNNAKELPDGTMLIKNDHYGNRVGYRLHGFGSTKEIESYLSEYYTKFSFGQSTNNYYGIDERLFWTVCHKKQG